MSATSGKTTSVPTPGDFAKKNPTKLMTLLEYKEHEAKIKECMSNHPSSGHFAASGDSDTQA